MVLADMEESPRKLGRPTKFTPETVSNILRYIKENHSSITDAAQRSGVLKSTVSLWMNSKDKKFRGFQREVRGALAEQKAILTESVYKHAKEDGHLALRALQSRFPVEWASHRIPQNQKVLNIDNRTVNVKVLNEGVRRKILESIRASEGTVEAVQVRPDAGGSGDVRSEAGDNS